MLNFDFVSQTMPGNVDGSQVEGTTVDIEAAYLRFTPKSFNNLVCMKVELYGCKSSETNGFPHAPNFFLYCYIVFRRMYFFQIFSLTAFFELFCKMRNLNLNLFQFRIAFCFFYNSLLKRDYQKLFQQHYIQPIIKMLDTFDFLDI